MKTHSDKSGECLECGKQTSNPKFCGRSCAAKYNNKKNPKRAPEGNCKLCDTPISSSRTYCKQCFKEKPPTTKKSQIDPESPTHPGVFTRKSLNYSFLSTPLSTDDSVGTFLDIFEYIAELTPDYLSRNDWQRHLEFVQLLKQFSYSHPRIAYPCENISVVDFPLTELSFLLHQWVRSIVFTKEKHPLAATFSLDTANILASHAWGRTIDSWDENSCLHIEPIIRDEKARYNEIAGPDLKKEITQHTVTGLHVIAQLPNEVKAVFHDQRIESETGKILFQVDRCHLSSGWYDKSAFVFENKKEKASILCGDFEFYGQALISPLKEKPEHAWNWWDYQPFFPTQEKDGVWLAKAYLPVKWITHCGYYSFTDAHIPVPISWKSLSGNHTNEHPGLKLFSQDDDP